MNNLQTATTTELFDEIAARHAGGALLIVADEPRKPGYNNTTGARAYYTKWTEALGLATWAIHKIADPSSFTVVKDDSP